MTVRSFGEIFEWRNDVTYPSRGARTIGADAALTKGLIERVWPRANVDARSPSILHEHGPIKRITRLMLDCKIERAKRKGARELAAKDGGGGERDREGLSIAEDRSFARQSAARFKSFAKPFRPV